MKALAVVLWGCCLSVNAQYWIDLTDFPGTARDDAATFTIGDNIYVGTGLEVGWGLTNDWYLFDAGPQQNWTQIASLPASPRQYSAAFATLDHGYLFGGLDANGALNDLWRYDTFTNSWSQRASLPSTGRYAACAFSDGYNGYVVTGMLATGVPTSELWMYEPTTDSWTQLADLPGPPRHRGHVFQQARMVFGGADSSFTPLQDSWSFDVFTQQWSPRAAMPIAVYGGAAVGFINSKNIVIGGVAASNTFIDSVMIYDWSSDQWRVSQDSHIGQGPDTRRGAIAAMGTVSPVSVFYGLGIDSSLVRYKDWYISAEFLGIDEVENVSFTLSPNPGTNNFTISTTATHQETELTVTDALGRVVTQHHLNSDVHQVRTDQWPPGLYHIHLQNGRSNSTAKWIKLGPTDH